MKRDRLTNRAFFLGQVRLLVGYKSGEDLTPAGTVIVGAIAIVIAASVFALLK